MNFDNEINRYNTNSLKYDFMKERKNREDIFPMWVADMDFKCADEILNDMHKRIDHGIFGYTKNSKDYFAAIEKWYHNHFDVELKEEWLITTPGVVFALATAVKTLTRESDYVLINNPVYYPFTEVIEDNNRKVISSDLILVGNHYEIDFEDFESKIKEYNIKLFLLCSPHNPVGRVWDKEELDQIIEICHNYNVFIVSDEIHSDFTWNKKHISLLKYKDYNDNIIVCTSPSKTFNLAGLQVSNIFIPNKEKRERFQKKLWDTGYSLINTMGLVACQSAYTNGEKWLQELKKYILENINYVDKFLKERLPKIKLIYPEGTYLLWLDFRSLSLNDEDIEKILLNDANIWLDSGNMFGDAGKKFQRINVALPRKKLHDALEKIEYAFKDY